MTGNEERAVATEMVARSDRGVYQSKVPSLCDDGMSAVVASWRH